MTGSVPDLASTGGSCISLGSSGRGGRPAGAKGSGTVRDAGHRRGHHGRRVRGQRRRPAPSRRARRGVAHPLVAGRRPALPGEPPPFSPADLVNHSCEPNCGIIGSCVMVAMRDVAAGEELCFDYAMTDTNDYDEFVCSCGTPSVAVLITGGDWKLPELQERYAGFFSSYITRKIAQTAGTER